VHEMRRNTEDKARIEEKQNRAITMYKNGDSLESIQKATGYRRNSILTLLRVKHIQEYSPQYYGPVPVYKALDRRKLRWIEINGKRYTDLFDFIGGI